MLIPILAQKDENRQTNQKAMQPTKEKTSSPKKYGNPVAGYSKGRIAKSRRGKNTNPVRIDRVDCIDISRLKVEINPFEVIARTGDHSFFSDNKNVCAYLKDTHGVLLQINQDWKDLDWPEDTKETDVLMEMHRRIIAYTTRYKLTHIFDRYGDESYHSFFKEHTNPNIYVPSVRFLVELKTLDPELYNIILSTIGKITKHIGMATWIEAYDTAVSYITDIINNEEIDTDDLHEIKTNLDYWLKGEPMILYENMQAKAKVSVATLTKWVKAYNWNTVFKKRVLVWLRLSLAVYKQKRRLEDYVCHNMPSDTLFPQDYCLFKWADNEATRVCHEFFSYMDEYIGSAETWGLSTKVALNQPPHQNDKGAILLNRWMAYSYFLFDDDFCKYLVKTKSDKLINIL